MPSDRKAAAKVSLDDVWNAVKRLVAMLPTGTSRFVNRNAGRWSFGFAEKEPF
jgi:hypothetical protein